jgi:hypothetical protein
MKEFARNISVTAFLSQDSRAVSQAAGCLSLDDVGAVVATMLWITAAGEWVLAAQM